MTLPEPDQASDAVNHKTPSREKPNTEFVREVKEEERYDIDGLPEPASYGAVLVALTKLDPLAQEVMIAQRISVMPSQRDGSMPVNIPRMVRGPWAHHLRKLGIFCIPELATHELVNNQETGIMANHTPAEMKKMTPNDMWEVAKSHNPDLANLVDNAKTPEERQQAMRVLAAKLPVEQRIALEKLTTLQNQEQ